MSSDSSSDSSSGASGTREYKAIHTMLIEDVGSLIRGRNVKKFLTRFNSKQYLIFFSNELKRVKKLLIPIQIG